MMLFKLQRLLLFVKGCLYFGFPKSYHAVYGSPNYVRLFYEKYGRVPTEQDQKKILDKVLWFEEHYQRAQTAQEVETMLENL